MKASIVFALVYLVLVGCGTKKSTINPTVIDNPSPTGLPIPSVTATPTPSSCTAVWSKNTFNYSVQSSDNSAVLPFDSVNILVTSSVVLNNLVAPSVIISTGGTFTITNNTYSSTNGKVLQLSGAFQNPTPNANYTASITVKDSNNQNITCKTGDIAVTRTVVTPSPSLSCTLTAQQNAFSFLFDPSGYPLAINPTINFTIQTNVLAAFENMEGTVANLQRSIPNQSGNTITLNGIFLKPFLSNNHIISVSVKNASGTSSCTLSLSLTSTVPESVNVYRYIVANGNDYVYRPWYDQNSNPYSNVPIYKLSKYQFHVDSNLSWTVGIYSCKYSANGSDRHFLSNNVNCEGYTQELYNNVTHLLGYAKTNNNNNATNTFQLKRAYLQSTETHISLSYAEYLLSFINFTIEFSHGFVFY